MILWRINVVNVWVVVSFVIMLVILVVFFLLINFCSKFYDIDRISDFGVCLVMCVSGVVWFCGKYVGGGKIFFLCEYFWWVGDIYVGEIFFFFLVCLLWSCMILLVYIVGCVLELLILFVLWDLLWKFVNGKEVVKVVDVIVEFIIV